MSYAKAIDRKGVDYFLVDYFIYNLLLDMMDGESATSVDAPGTVMKNNSFVDYSKNVNLQYLKNVLGEPNIRLLVTFAFDPNAIENDNPVQNLGLGCEFHPFNRVYQIYLTMSASDTNRDVLNKLTTVFMQNLTLNNNIYTKTLTDSNANSVTLGSSLRMNQQTSEPIIVNEFEGLANYMTSTFSIRFNIFKEE